MRVLRLSLVAATAIIAAACGDKVTVAGPSSTALKIESVLVAPSSATISVGQAVTLTAAVNVDAGVTATVAWSSSSAAATLSSSSNTGTTVTGALSSPGVAVCATASAANAASVENCATVVVQPAQTITPAVLQIASVTGANGLNAPVPVPPGVVAGQINVSVNVNPGTEKIDSVQVLLNGKVAGTQTFTSGQAAALRSAANDALAAQGLLPTLVFSINTAAYNTTTGAVTYPNGALTISAVAYGHQGASAATNSAAQSAAYIVGNADGFQVTLTNNGHTANDATGYAWWGNGTVTVNARPVMYSGKTVGTVTASLGSGATGGTCAAGVGAAVSSTTATAGTYVIILPLAAAQSPAGCTTTTPNLPLITALDAGGNVIALGGLTNWVAPAIGVLPTSFTGVLNAQTGVRFDNVAPPTAGLIANLAVNGRTGNWINDAVTLNTVTSATNLNGAIAAAVVDAGIGGTITYNVQVGTTYALAKTSPALANSSTLAMLATNASYCAVVYTADLLGNSTTSPGGTCASPAVSTTYLTLPAAGSASVQFGVDRIAPLISYSGGLAANALVATATLATEFRVTVSDTGLVGNSGMQPANPVLMQVSQVLAAGNGPGTTSCLNANNTAATCGTLTATGVNVAGNPIYTTAMAALTANAYLTFTATATDAAGNSTTIAPRIVAHDAGPLLVGNVSTPITVSAQGYSASAFINDGLDIGSFSFSGDFATLPAPFAAGPSPAPLRFVQAVTAVDGFNAASFLNTNYAITGPVTLPLALQSLAGTLYPMSNINANATNVVNTNTVGGSVVTPTVTPALVAFAPGILTFPAITNSIASNNISSGVTTTATAGNPATGTLTVTATGQTATFNNPFSRVDFYAVNNTTGVGATGTQWVLIGSTTVQTLVDVGATRTFSWTLPISGATLYTQLGYGSAPVPATAVTNVIAIGYNASGSIGIFNTAPYALNIIK